ncbi:MAG: hypothetical protein AAB380_05010 [Verrucomicrobiota bacterium]
MAMPPVNVAVDLTGLNLGRPSNYFFIAQQRQRRRRKRYLKNSNVLRVRELYADAGYGVERVHV